MAECLNAAVYSSDVVVSTCSTCFSYQCIDWVMGSAGMKAREDSYNMANKDSVYFAVGAYGSDPSRGGLCYRITVPGTDRDIIAQVHTSPSSFPCTPENFPPPAYGTRSSLRRLHPPPRETSTCWWGTEDSVISTRVHQKLLVCLSTQAALQTGDRYTEER